MPRSRRLAGALAVAGLGALGLGALGACSSSGGSSTPTIASSAATGGGSSAGGFDGALFPTPAATATSTAGDPGNATTSATEALPRVDLIGPAIAALETALGAQQQYFEINATSKLVNLIIAVNDATLAQSWLYLDGQLSSKDAQPASGHTFAAAALNFDPAGVLTQIHRDLPASVLDFFYVLGGDGGSVQYKVATTSSKGGQLEVTLGPDGTVRQVDPITSGDTSPGASATTAPGAPGATLPGVPETTAPVTPVVAATTG